MPIPQRQEPTHEGYILNGLYSGRRLLHPGFEAAGRKLPHPTLWVAATEELKARNQLEWLDG